jgi:effector-binding domain-containing protein
MDYAITERELCAQPVLLIRRRLERSQLAATLGPLYAAVVDHAQRVGAPLAGPPFTRYVEWGPGLLTIEAGLPVAAPVVRGGSGGEVQAGTLAGGRAATTTHPGAYDRLLDAYAALERWIEARGRVAAGLPWEVYITDPAEVPDARDWRTEVFWPIAPRA